MSNIAAAEGAQGNVNVAAELAREQGKGDPHAARAETAAATRTPMPRSEDSKTAVSATPDIANAKGADRDGRRDSISTTIAKT